MGNARKKALVVLRRGKRFERKLERIVSKRLRGDLEQDKPLQGVNHPWLSQDLGSPAVVDEMEKRHCCGCSSCMNSCPVNAISMAEDEEGFLYPSVDRDTCIECGACIKHCPTYIGQPANWNTGYCYATIAEDDAMRKKSSSGGLFSQLARYAFEKGGVVFGAAYDGPDRVAHTYVESMDALDKLRRSKYVQSDTSDSYPLVKRFLQEGRFVLFSGCPCQVAGLYAFLGRDYDNLLTVDLLCHGTPSPALFRRYVQEYYGGKEIDEISFRDKTVFGWSTHMNVYLANGDVIREMGSKDPYCLMFFRCLGNRPFCSICKYACMPRVGDLTIGDWWGVEKYDRTLNDGMGTSLALVNNDKGVEAFTAIVPSMSRCVELPLEDARPRNRAIDKPLDAHPARGRFFRLLNFQSFEKAVHAALDNHYDVGIYGLWYGENYGSMLTYYGLREVIESMGLSTLMVFNPLANRQGDLEPYRFARRQRYEIALPRPLSRMRELNMLCDSFVLGSDQLWNPGLSRPYRFSYFLDFVADDNKRIAYGTSFGKPGHKISDRYRTQSAMELAKFDAISVRDDFSKKTLDSKYGGIKSVKVLDPALLCDPKSYSRLADQAAPVRLRIPGGLEWGDTYLFAYILDPNPDSMDALADISARMGKKIMLAVDYSPRSRGRNVGYFENAEALGIHVLDVPSCEQWLRGIRDADAVLTDSFHGMVFSLVFEKNYVAVSNKRRGAERFRDISDMLGVSDRLMETYIGNTEEVCDLLSTQVDYTLTNGILNEKRGESYRWLQDALTSPKIVKTDRAFKRIEE